RVTKYDISIIEFIVANLIDNNDERASSEHLQHLLTDDRTSLFAVLTDTEVIGYTLAYKFPSLYSSNFLAYLYDIEIVEQHRKKGAGRLLMNKLLADLKKDNVDELFLGTATDNIAGQALFSSTGGIKSEETFN